MGRWTILFEFRYSELYVFGIVCSNLFCSKYPVDSSFAQCEWALGYTILAILQVITNFTCMEIEIPQIEGVIGLPN